MSSSGALAAAGTNLPSPLTRFVGRESELDEAAGLLLETRLLTLTGPGGAGKTRLALRLAAAVAEDFPDGVWFVDFSPLSGGEFVWDQVAITLGIKEPGPSGTLADAVGRYLAPRQALVVLDNCEHVVEAAAGVTASLLAAAPELKMVTTSREPLGVGGEVTWAVPALSDGDAVELFSDRARQAQPRFRLRGEDADVVRSICRRLDGLPLAIELAAARTRALSPARIAAHLQNHFRLLPSGPRTAPGRQATLRASFEWSHELLPEAERALLRQLSVFAGEFDLEAVLAVCPAASIELLAGLADRSLIRVDDRTDQAENRYRMLETIREFAAERLADVGEVDLVRARHRDHYLALAEAAEANLAGLDMFDWSARLLGEQANLRAALTWSQDHGEAQALARLAVALAPFWLARGRNVEAETLLRAAADRAAAVSPLLQAQLRNLECMHHILTGRSFGEVPALANEALALARAAGDKHEEAAALTTLGLMAGLLGGAEAMRPYREQALSLARSAGVATGTRLLMMAFAPQMAFLVLRWFQSDPEEPRRLAQEMIDRAKARRDSQLLATAMWLAGFTALIQGRLADAAQFLETALARAHQTDESIVWKCCLGLAWVAMLRGDFAAARTAVSESVAAAQRSHIVGGSERMVDPFAKWILGWMELASGGAARARDTLAELVGVIRPTSLFRFVAGPPLVILAESHLALGGLDEAVVSLDEATSLARAGALTWVLGRAGLVRAKLRAREGDPQEAESLAHEAVALGREAGDKLGLVDGLELLARLAAELDSPKEAARLLAAVESLRSELGYARFPVDQRPYDAAVARAREALAPDDFAAAWGEGANLSVDAAIAYAARGRGERRRPTAGWASLTPSELEVVRLVGQHLSNPAIAARLFVSRATVKTHLVHIFSKLGIDSRSALAAEAVRRGIQTEPSLRS
jgi:predicted ATPase/DNA-binding CsgD family transcriptional regulator